MRDTAPETQPEDELTDPNTLKLISFECDKTTDDEIVADLVEGMKEGDAPPTVDVFEEGEDRWVGRDRLLVKSAVAAGVSVKLNLREGGRSQALLEAVRAVCALKSVATLEGQKQAAHALLSDPLHQLQSDRWIGRQCGLAAGTIKKIADSIPGITAQREQWRVGEDLRKIRIESIGRGKITSEKVSHDADKSDDEDESESDDESDESESDDESDESESDDPKPPPARKKKGKKGKKSEPSVLGKQIATLSFEPGLDQKAVVKLCRAMKLKRGVKITSDGLGQLETLGLGKMVGLLHEAEGKYVVKVYEPAS